MPLGLGALGRQMQPPRDRHAEAASVGHDRRHTATSHRLFDRPCPCLERWIRRAGIDAPRRLEQAAIARLLEPNATLPRRLEKGREFAHGPGPCALPQQRARMRKRAAPDPQNPWCRGQAAGNAARLIKHSPEQLDDRPKRRLEGRSASRPPRPRGSR